MGLNTKDLQTTGDFLFIYVTREFSDTIILKVKSYHLASYNVVLWTLEDNTSTTTQTRGQKENHCYSTEVQPSSHSSMF